MENNKLKFGIVTFWTLGASSLSRLRVGLTACGLEKYCPEEGTPLNSLRQALSVVYPDRLIRRLAGKGFTVVDEQKGNHENMYGFIASAWLEGDELELKTHGVDEDKQREITESYCASRDTITANQLGALLSRFVTQELAGTALRRSGGVYWMQDTRLPRWQEVVQAVEGAAQADASSSVYVLRNEIDGEAVRAVRDAIVAEMDGEAARLTEAISSGELGGLALEHRQRDARELIAKLREYESLVGSLETVRNKLEQVETAAATAALLVASEILDIQPVGAA